MVSSKITRNGQVTIPKSIRTRAGLREGMTVYFHSDGSEVILLPAVLRSQRWFWTREWQKMEAEADEDLRSRRLRSFASVEEALTWLNRKRR